MLKMVQSLTGGLRWSLGDLGLAVVKVSEKAEQPMAARRKGRASDVLAHLRLARTQIVDERQKHDYD